MYTHGFIRMSEMEIWNKDNLGDQMRKDIQNRARRKWTQIQGKQKENTEEWRWFSYRVTQVGGMSMHVNTATNYKTPHRKD